jgi:hypothetical protein
VSIVGPSTLTLRIHTHTHTHAQELTHTHARTHVQELTHTNAYTHRNTHTPFLASVLGCFGAVYAKEDPRERSACCSPPKMDLSLDDLHSHARTHRGTRIERWGGSVR